MGLIKSAYNARWLMVGQSDFAHNEDGTRPSRTSITSLSDDIPEQFLPSWKNLKLEKLAI